MSSPEESLDEARQSDATARHDAQRVFDRPLVVQAGAGTGKTATLVARVLAWCLGPGWDRAHKESPEAEPARVAELVLRGVVAITFTEAAAAEMDERIERGLATLAQGKPLIGFDCEAPLDRVAALRGALDHLAVDTIHAFCRRLITRWPLEAEVHPLFEVDADFTALEEAVREVCIERLGPAYLARDEDLLALAERGIGPGEIETILFEQLKGGATARELAEDMVGPERCAELAARLLEAHRELERAADGRLALVKRGTKAKEVDAALGHGTQLLQEPCANPRDLIALKDALSEAWSKTAKRAIATWSKGRSKDFSKAELDELGEELGDFAAAASTLSVSMKHLDKLEPELLARQSRVLAMLAPEVAERLKRRGRVGFDGLLERAAAVLEVPQVIERERAGVAQLLVDEFQDTDPRQCAIVRALALEGPQQGRPGLFLVGDPKQSIYGWRSADLEAYEGMVGEVVAAGGQRVSLSINYRSVPAVLDVVEYVIEPVMQYEAGVQPPFERLVPCPAFEKETGFNAEGFAPVEFWIPARWDDTGQPVESRAPEATGIEASALARDLQTLHEGGNVAWKDVGLLFRSRGDWDVYLSALREAEIPYLVEGDRSYYRRREILDASSIVACVLDPNDVLALVATLRSSLAGVPDAAWIPLWAGGLPTLAAKLGEEAAALESARALILRVAGELDPNLPGLARIPGWEQAACAALEALAALRRSHAQEPGDVFVERLRSLTAFEGVEAARTLGHWRSSNLDRFFNTLAADLSEAGSVSAVLRQIRRTVNEEELPSAEPATRSEADAVSVVTLHGAKGLDWDHVYLMQLHKGSWSQASENETGRIGGRLEGRWGTRPTLGGDQLTQRRSRVSQAELVRTLYVGMTRARRRLVVSGLWSDFMKSNAPGSHSRLLGEGFGHGLDLSALVAKADATGAVKEFGVLWRFVGRNHEERPHARTRDRRPREVARAWAGTAARAKATARMARHRGMAVTAWVDASDSGAAPTQERRGSGVGRIVGTAVHAALERLDLGDDFEADWAAQRLRLEADLRRLATPRVEAAVEDALGVWDALAAGELAPRLRELAPRLLARELPILMPLADDPEARDLAEFASGAIDLLYRDPDGRLVVADYKTDPRDPDSGPTERASRYARQGALYCRAVAEALGAEDEPRFELWWLRSGEVENVPIT